MVSNRLGDSCEADRMMTDEGKGRPDADRPDADLQSAAFRRLEDVRMYSTVSR